MCFQLGHSVSCLCDNLGKEKSLTNQFEDEGKGYCHKCKSTELEWEASNLWCRKCGEMQKV
jgi:ribosomal protein L37AE/L43A